MRRFFGAVAGVALFGGIAFFLLTIPRGLSSREIAALPEGDAARGETWFWAGGCGSCHAADRAKGEEKLPLGGGLVLATDFGDFVAPNISMHPEDGIGSWTAADFVVAMKKGVSPDGRHYYPAFPYASFTRMETSDVVDLWAFMRTLPVVEGEADESDLAFPFNIRRGVGLWKLAFLDSDPVVAIPSDDPVLARGRYLVEGAGHCAECHTPRGLGGNLDTARWMAGAPVADGPGNVPDITPGDGGMSGWSVADIAYYLETGFTPEFDTVGGSMVSVQDNMSMLEPGDREAIATYIHALPSQAAVR